MLWFFSLNKFYTIFDKLFKFQMESTSDLVCCAEKYSNTFSDLALGELEIFFEKPSCERWI